MLKIQGLVGAFNKIRTQLQSGLHEHELGDFKKRVAKIISDIEEICLRHGATINQLSAPSRNAYWFLKKLDLNNLPVNKSENLASRGQTFKIKNLVKMGDAISDGIWRRLNSLLANSEERIQLLREIEKHASTIEQMCQKYDQTPSALELPSRQTYCWLKFLANNNNLATHLEAIRLAKEALASHPQNPNKSVLVHLVAMSSVWRRLNYQNAELLKINEGFLNADRTVWQALIETMRHGGKAASDNLVMEFTASDDFSEALLELDSFAAVETRQARGLAHDLEESFARVNAEYFGGQISKPTLIWNRTLTTRKFGHYQPSRDTIMVSVSLDDPTVPAFVVDFLIYHELLHKKHGGMFVNGRRLSHSPAFREEERKFAAYQQAESFLKKLALNQLSSGEIVDQA